jgi:hypothetical protein
MSPAAGVTPGSSSRAIARLNGVALRLSDTIVAVSVAERHDLFAGPHVRRLAAQDAHQPIAPAPYWSARLGPSSEHLSHQ